MRIAFVHPGAIDTPTGGYSYDRRIIRELKDLGHDIVPLRLDGAYPTPSAAEVTDGLARLAATAPGTIIFGDGLALSALPTDALKQLGRPVVLLVHHPLALETGLAPEVADRLFASEKAVLGAADAIVAISPETWRVLLDRFAVPQTRMTLALPGTEPAARVVADGTPPRLIAVGSLTPRKGYPVLLDAVERLGDIPFTLTIVGSPHLDPDTAALVAQRAAGHANIRLVGQLAPAALDAAYQEADIFVHPSLYEGYGMVLAEAMRRGLPVVCTTGGASGETVPDGAGLKVPPGDPEALAAALRRLITEPALRRQIADGAFAAGQSLPTWQDTARTIAGVLESVAR